WHRHASAAPHRTRGARARATRSRGGRGATATRPTSSRRVPTRTVGMASRPTHSTRRTPNVCGICPSDRRVPEPRSWHFHCPTRAVELNQKAACRAVVVSAVNPAGPTDRSGGPGGIDCGDGFNEPTGPLPPPVVDEDVVPVDVHDSVAHAH